LEATAPSSSSPLASGRALVVLIAEATEAEASPAELPDDLEVLDRGANVDGEGENVDVERVDWEKLDGDRVDWENVVVESVDCV